MPCSGKKLCGCSCVFSTIPLKMFILQWYWTVTTSLIMTEHARVTNIYSLLLWYSSMDCFRIRSSVQVFYNVWICIWKLGSGGQEMLFAWLMEQTYFLSTRKSLLFSVNFLFIIYFFSQFQMCDLLDLVSLDLNEALSLFSGILIVTGCYSYFSEEGRRWSGAKPHPVGKNCPVLSRCHWNDFLSHYCSAWWGSWKGASDSCYQSLSWM